MVLFALWTLLALTAPANALLVWLSLPVAIILAALAQRSWLLRTPTAFNAVANYISVAAAEAGLGHWVLASPDVLRDKLIILTLLGLISVAQEALARFIDAVRISSALMRLEEAMRHTGGGPLPRRPRPRRMTRSRPTRPHRSGRHTRAGTRPRRVRLAGTGRSATAGKR